MTENVTYYDNLLQKDISDTTRKRAKDEIDTNGAPEKWCATTIY